MLIGGKNEGARGDEGLRFFLESRKKQRTCVRRERKVDLIWKAAVMSAPVAGESLNRPDESKLSSVRFLLSLLVVLRTPCADLRSACHGGRQVARATPSFHPIDFHVTHRFFVTFLVRPALLPYGKRGFRAAIYKIARPQPPAAAL